MSTAEEEEDGFLVTSPTVGDKEEDSDLELSSDEEEDGESSLKRRFDDIIDDLKALDIKDSTNHYLCNPAKLEAFANEALWLREKTAGDSDTLLHLLVEHARDKVFEKYQPLITLLIERYPRLLRSTNGNDRTPLYMAIGKRREKLVRLMCTIEKDIDSVFRICCHQSNCLHIAISSKNSQPKLVNYLIGFASKATLCGKDTQGNTPLHLAVEYSRCFDTQLDVVKAIVEKCTQTIDQKTDAPNSFSPYQYHEYTRAIAIKQEEVERRAKGKERAATQTGDGSTKQKVPNPVKNPKTAVEPKGQPQGGAAMPMEPPAKNFSMKRTNTGVEAFNPKAPLAVPPRVDGPSSIDGRSSVKDEGRRKSRRSKEEKKVTEESANAVKEYLKLYCLRNRNGDDAVEFLYGTTQENQIYFDLYDTPSLTISEERIEAGLAHLRFEDVLQYVALPNLHVEKLPVPAKFKKHQQPDGRGRTDMEFLFDFLRAKRVKRVIRVIVEDKSDPPHSDESIERCLGGLQVEIWDWKKIDLCTETIRSAAPDVRELSLYWSGNNAVLRGWSEREGLNALPKLQSVHLHVQQGLETATRTGDRIEAFIRRIKLLRPEIKIDVEMEHQTVKQDPTGTASDPTPTQAEPGHKWLSCMDDFANFIYKVGPPLPLLEPITVALIDDGVDINEQSLNERIIGGRSFCQRDKYQGLSMPYYVSSGGHGTVMASLICRVCPNANLYVVKLDEYIGENQKRQITAKSAEKAVRAAIAKGVHIISMSWTIERTATNTADIANLESAINAAANANILMFCAANDQGISKDHSFPAATSTTKNIFKIGAAEASGKIWSMSGDVSDVDFIFPGHNVVKDRPNDAPLERCKTLTGSSVATAVASGLAALVLYCIQLGALNTKALKLTGPAATTMDDFQAVRKHERMKEAFQMIGTSIPSGNKYIEVWDVFGEAAKQAESASRDRRVAIVAELAVRLKTTKKYA